MKNQELTAMQNSWRTQKMQANKKEPLHTFKNLYQYFLELSINAGQIKIFNNIRVHFDGATATKTKQSWTSNDKR